MVHRLMSSPAMIWAVILMPFGNGLWKALGSSFEISCGRVVEEEGVVGVRGLAF